MRASTSTAATVLLVLGVTGVRSQDRSNEAEEAAITNPTAECQSYDYPPVDNALSSFPGIWDYASTILASDTAGHAKFATFNSSIPNIAPRGTLTGDMSGVQYSDSDPDCWWTYSNCVTPKLSGLKPDIASVPEPHTLGYGFDDGPYCGHNVFYDYLASQNQKATMFYIGSNVMNNPLEAQRAVVDGHQICVHTWSHNYMTSTSNEGAFAELWYAMKAIKLVTGVTPTCWRPPYGDVDDRIRYIAGQLGLETIIWQYDSNDWEEGTNGVTAATVQANYDALMANATAGAFDTVGAIMLTHELTNFTMQMAIDNHPKLLTAFQHLVPIAVAQNITNPYVETNYTMPSFLAYINGVTVTNASSVSASPSSTQAAPTSTSASRTSSQANPSQTSKTTNKSGASALRVPIPAIAALVMLGSLLRISA
ncbi:carbohydrate esterase family 4 protein [Mycena galericulata]|nr:carbohydrate esterase family 4 protein [Mycena galericulata]